MANPQQQAKNQLLQALVSGNSQVIKEFYSSEFGKIVALVKRHNGSVEDAKDIFQDALMILYQKAKAPDFELQYALSTYFYTICKNLCWQKARRQNRMTSLTELEESTTDLITEDLDQRAKQRLFLSKLKELSAACQQILQLFFAKKTMEEIAQIMDLGSAGYAKKRKYKCQKSLLERIKADPLYQELIN